MAILKTREILGSHYPSHVSEETDAVVIVVSEETGSVALSVGGEMETDLHMGSLRDRITEIFTAGGDAL